MPTPTRSAAIRARLDHPVVDGDGHNTPYGPLFEDYVREFGGARAVDRYRTRSRWQEATSSERAASRIAKGCFGFPTRNTLDYLTGMLPSLLAERMPEMGLDFSVIYPTTQRVGSPDMRADEDLRHSMCRALNTYQSEVFRPFADRLTPAAAIPMSDPVGACEELDYAVGTLGMKAVQMSSYARRDGSANGLGIWWDCLALDSPHDYDPVWQKCLDLKVSPGFHSGTMGMGSRLSYTNAVFNHVGHFAAGCEAMCKALVLGGVTYRYPDLRFLFLESGMGWASSLFSDLVGHWKKRNREALKDLDPANLDLELARTLVTTYGTPRMVETLEHIGLIRDRADWIVEEEFPDDFDDFAAAHITTPSDLVERFVPNFFFGCEGDDPLNVLAFIDGLLPEAARLRCVFGSDIGHWDVPDVSEALEEAYELVEEEKIDDGQFRSFVFENPVAFYTSGNPDFFRGTAIEAEVARIAPAPAKPGES